MRHLILFNSLVNCNVYNKYLYIYIIVALLSLIRCHLEYAVSFKRDYIMTNIGGKQCHKRFEIYIGMNFR